MGYVGSILEGFGRIVGRFLGETFRGQISKKQINSIICLTVFVQ